MGLDVPPPSHRDGNLFSTVLAAAPAHVATSRQQFAHWLNGMAVSPARAYEIVLAVTEAVTNAMEHGSRFDSSKLVAVEASLRNACVTATVSDSGRWIHSSPHPTNPTQRGRGLMLIKTLANAVDVLPADDGTHITMQFDI